MEQQNGQKKLAVLIDADNTPPSIIDALLAEIAKYGIASVRRIYGDWTTPNLRGWKDVLLEQAIQGSRRTVRRVATSMRWICCIRRNLMASASCRVIVTLRA